MEKEFYWLNEHDSEEVAFVEQKITDFLAEESFVPCHTGALKIYLDITKALDTMLEGNITCQCGKKLLTFQGTSDAKNLEINQNF